MSRRRERILETARKVIAKRGYEYLTMRSLAEMSGVTMPTIYNLIGNKDAVLAAAIHEGTVRFFGDVQPSAGPIAILEKNVAELLGQPAYYRSVLRVLLHGGASDAMAEIDELYLRHLRDALEVMVERGELEAWVDSAVLAERLLSNFYGATSEWTAGLLDDTTLPLAVSFDANLTLAGVATDENRKRFQNRARRLQKRGIETGRASKRKAGGRSTRNRA